MWQFHPMSMLAKLWRTSLLCSLAQKMALPFMSTLAPLPHLYVAHRETKFSSTNWCGRSLRVKMANCEELGWEWRVEGEGLELGREANGMKLAHKGL